MHTKQNKKKIKKQQVTLNRTVVPHLSPPFLLLSHVLPVPALTGYNCAAVSILILILHGTNWVNWHSGQQECFWNPFLYHKANNILTLSRSGSKYLCGIVIYNIVTCNSVALNYIYTKNPELTISLIQIPSSQTLKFSDYSRHWEAGMERKGTCIRILICR